MSFNTETPQTIQRRQEAEAEMVLPGSSPRIANTPEALVTRATTLVGYELHKHIDEEAKEILPHTATRTLPQHGSMQTVDQKSENKAQGIAQFTGIDGAIIPALTIIQRADNVQFVTTADVTIVGTTVNGTIEAVNAGANGNTPAATNLELISPLIGIESTVIVDVDGLSLGADIERVEPYRERILEQWRQPPHGGALFDYSYWAKQVPGVTRAWPFENLVQGIPVSITFVIDDRDDIFPTALEVAAVEEYIDTQRPVGALFEVFAPTAKSIDMEIGLNPNTVAVQETVRAELEDFFKREAEPGKTLRLSRLQESISVATGEFHHVLITPNADIVADESELPTLGTITWSLAT